MEEKRNQTRAPGLLWLVFSLAPALKPPHGAGQHLPFSARLSQNPPDNRSQRPDEKQESPGFEEIKKDKKITIKEK